MVVVNNIDVAGLVRRMERFKYELEHCVSANGSEVKAADLKRIRSYLDALVAYTDHVVAQPQLDLPETSPRAIQLGELGMPMATENESIQDLLHLLTLARDELVNSQSARDASGLKSFDHDRLVAMATKAYNFLDNYVATFTPLDLPESSPMTAQTPAGRQGI